MFSWSRYSESAKRKHGSSLGGGGVVNGSGIKISGAGTGGGGGTVLGGGGMVASDWTT